MNNYNKRPTPEKLKIYIGKTCHTNTECMPNWAPTWVEKSLRYSTLDLRLFDQINYYYYFLGLQKILALEDVSKISPKSASFLEKAFPMLQCSGKA